jgi:hypothetical protein
MDDLYKAEHHVPVASYSRHWIRINSKDLAVTPYKTEERSFDLL